MKYILLLPLLFSCCVSDTTVKRVALKRTHCVNKLDGKAFITYYQPTTAQCGNSKNICADGTKGRLGVCAVSKKMLKYVKMGDTIEIKGSYAGRYRVSDLAGSKTELIDIWKPIGYNGIKNCYKSYFKIIKNGKNYN